MTQAGQTKCPSCAAPVSQRTLTRYDGVCRRCKGQPIEFRKQWIFLFVMACAAPIAAIFIDQELAELEANGESKRVHVLIAMMYRIGGRMGVAILFSLVGLVCAILAYRSFRNLRLAKATLSESMSSKPPQESNDHV